jgi:hypothetical protein
MQDDRLLDTLKTLYSDRSNKNSKTFDSLDDNPNQEKLYGEILREVDTHEFDDEELQHESSSNNEDTGSLYDSVLFLIFARESLVYAIENNPDLSKTDKKEIKNFVLKEATDYEILSLLVENKVPEKRNDFNLEYNLTNLLNKFFYENNNIFTQNIGVLKLVPLSIYGISSQPKDIKFISENESKIVLEKKLEHEGKKSVGPTKDPKTGETLWVWKNPKTGESEKISSEEQAKRLGLTGFYKKVKPIDDKAKQILDKIMFWKKETKPEVKLTKGQELLQKVRQIPSGYKFISVATITALLSFISYKIYKSIKEKRFKQCSNLPGEAKKLCIQKAIKDSLTGQIKQLRDSIKYCDRSSDPSKCKAEINKKISKLESKIKV